MQAYAEVVHGKVIAVGSCPDGFTPEFASPIECVFITVETGTPVEGSVYGEGVFSEPVPVVVAPAVAARSALSESDIVIIRCLEEGVAIPQEWKDYRATLRTTSTGGGSTVPTVPEVPY